MLNLLPSQPNQPNLHKPVPSFFNTLTRKIEQILPLDENHLKMYVCGPTVYDRPHIGNARSAVVYDLFFRLFSQLFQRVSYVRNITDVDDKINLAAKKRGISINQLTQEITEFYHQDTDALNVLRPNFEPKVTENIPEIIELISKLLARNAAYESSGHVLFDVKSYANYGQLSNRKIDEMLAGARIEVGEYKKNPLDFVLWKPADEQDDPSSLFKSPWGLGRPGWHIECSAMSLKFLGSNFDIHGGGADLQFPHHENEIAQTCAAYPQASYARYWIHNGFLTVNGEKMSKSLNNFITVRDLLNAGVEGEVIRLMLLSAHYRKPLDFNDKGLADAKKALSKFLASISPIFDISKAEFDEILSQKNPPSAQILKHLCDDLNFAKVLAFLHEKTAEIKGEKTNEKLAQLKSQLAIDLNFLGLLPSKISAKNFQNSNHETRACLQNNCLDLQTNLGESQATIPDKYRDISREFCEESRLKESQSEANGQSAHLSLKTGSNQKTHQENAQESDLKAENKSVASENFEGAKADNKTQISEELLKEIQHKIDLRAEFKKQKNFAAADEIRQELVKMGVAIEDQAGGKTKWELRR